jgi:hypothetical protein
MDRLTAVGLDPADSEAGPTWVTLTAVAPGGDRRREPDATIPLMATVPIPIPTRPASMRRPRMGP